MKADEQERVDAMMLDDGTIIELREGMTLVQSLSKEEKTLLRQLISDRIENRFSFAAKAANDLNSTRLEAAAKEIKGLEALREKLS